MRYVVLTTMAFIISAAIVLTACKHQPYVLPVSMRTGDSSICFERDILPIFISNCAKSGCHDGNGESDYVLNSYNNIVRKGIVPGNPEASKIYTSMTGSGEDLMPKDSPPLSAAQLGLIKQWIYSGAVNGTNCSSTCDTTNFTYSGAIKPMIDNYCLGCHSSSSAASSGGGVIMDSYDRVKALGLNDSLVKAITGSGYAIMPQGGAPLSDCQVTQVKKWVAAGAPNN